jgi:hypothetical protein
MTTNEPGELNRPRQVSVAVFLFSLGLGLGILNFFIEWQFWTSFGHPLKWMFIGQIATVAVFGWAMYMVWIGRGWARTVALIAVALKLLSVLQLPDTFQRSLLAGSISVLQFLLFLSAVFFLYTSPSRGWFQVASPKKAMEPTR